MAEHVTPDKASSTLSIPVAKAGETRGTGSESVPFSHKGTSATRTSKSSGETSFLGRWTEKLQHYGSLSGQRDNPPEEMFRTSHNNKVIVYDHNQLLSWSVFCLIGQSVFVQPPVLKTFIFCTSLATGLAIIVFFLPSASKIDTQRFEILCDFLTVFITFMLGIYVQQAFKHWWYSVTTFEHFLSTIRQLIFMLHQLKLEPGYVKQVEDLCVVSTYIFNLEVKNALSRVKPGHKDHHNVQTLIVWLQENKFLSEAEKDWLNDHGTAEGIMSRTRAVWSFIGEMLAHVSELTGKTLPPPVETRLIGICQDCIGSIEDLKMNITVQTPFMYAHLLAFLVHVNNFVLSATCGICIGSALNETRLRSEQLNELNHGRSREQRRQEADYGDSMSGGGLDAMDMLFLARGPGGEINDDARVAFLTRQFYEAIQITWIKILMVLLGPILHVAFLHIAHLLCYPFGNEPHHLPLETLIARLHSELYQMKLNRQFFRGTIESRKELSPYYEGAQEISSPFQEKEPKESPFTVIRGSDIEKVPPADDETKGPLAGDDD